MSTAQEIPTTDIAIANETIAMEEGTPEDINNESVVDVDVDVDVAADESEETNTTDRSAWYKRILILLVLVGFIVFVVVDTQTNNYIRTGIVAFLEWIEDNTVAGVFCFIGVYFLATVFWVPGSILTLGSGFVFTAALDSLGWGVLLATAAVWVGATLGAIVSFLIGRYVLRETVSEKLAAKYKIFQALDNAMEEKGLLITVLCRLSPIVPFNAFNYLWGVTAVKFRDYCIACIAMLPGTILYVFLGASVGSLTEIGEDDEDSPSNSRAVTITIIVAGIVFTLLAVLVAGWYAKKELAKIIDENKPADEGESAEMSQVHNGDEEAPPSGAEEEESV